MRTRAIPAAPAALAAGFAAAIVHRSWIRAQCEVAVVLSTMLDTPVLTPAAMACTGEPRSEEVVVAGVPATVVRPGGDGPWPAFVFLSGASELGRAHPDVQRFAQGVARAGYLALVPDPPGLARGALCPATVDGVADVAVAATARDDVRGRISLFGASLGATIALLAAERPALTGRVSVVVGIAPFTDLANVIRIGTTGYTREGGRDVFYGPEPFLALAVARSVAAGIPARSEQQALAGLLDGVAADDPEPLRALDGVAARDAGVRAAVDLLSNRDPQRFDELYAALPAEARATIASLSPLNGAERLALPVELASAPHDVFFPVSESYNLARAAPRVRVTVTEAFRHVIPRPSLGDPRDLLAFDGWAVRSLRAARR
jgi:pimeloyl-ACP methyl ester carboxylesterase